MRILFFIAASLLALPGLSACSTPRSAAPSDIAPSLLGIQLEPDSPLEMGDDGGVRNLRIDVNALLRAELCSASERRETGADGRNRDSEHSACAGTGDDAQAFSVLAGRLERRDDVDRRRIRNALVAQLVHASNVNCRTYLWSLRGTQVGGRLASDIFTNAFTLAGTLNEHLPSAQLLSGLGAFSSSAGASVDRSVFAQAGVEIVADQVILMRRERRALLEQNLQKSYTLYPLGFAMADVAEYHQDCSMMRGLTRMQDELRRREEAVLISRQTALRVMESGGDARAVAAAVGGVTDVYLGLEPMSQSPAAPLATHYLNNAPRLDRIRAEVLALMPETEGVSIDAVKQSLTAELGAALAAACGSAPVASPAASPTANGAAPAAAASTQVPIPQEKRFACEALRIMSAAGQSAYAERRREAGARMAEIREEIVSVRVTAAEQIRRLGEVGAQYETVMAALARLRGAPDAPHSYHDDPVLSAMAQSAEGDNRSGAQAANIAVATAIAVIVSEEEDERRRRSATAR